jgi:hypothetical protein
METPSRRRSASWGAGATHVGTGAWRLGLRWSPCSTGRADQPGTGRALAGGDQVLADDGQLVRLLVEPRETNDPICAMAAVTVAFDSNTDRCRTVMSPWVWIERWVNKVLCAAPLAALLPHDVARHDGEPITVAELGPPGGNQHDR